MTRRTVGTRPTLPFGILLSLSLSLSLGVHAESKSGLSVGPYGVAVQALVINPATPSTIYVAAYAPTGGGLFKSTDSGVTWTSVGAGIPSTVFYQSHFAINPSTTSTLYVGGRGGLFKSTDSGGSWNDAHLGSGADVMVDGVTISPAAPSTLYAIKDTDVFKSTNAGDTWVKFDTGLSYSAVRLAINPVTTSTIYAGTSVGVFRSTDAGFSWNPTRAGLPTGSGNSSNISYIYGLAIDPVTPSTLYAGTNGAGIYKSTDSGATWYAANTSITATIYVRALVVDPTRASTLYAGGSNGSSGPFTGIVFKSTDSGDTWTALMNGLPALATAYLYDLAIDPVTPSTMWAGLSTGLYKSTDSGNTWTLLQAPVEPPSASFFVPVVLSANGANNSAFSSELTLTNRGTSPAAARYSYTASAGGGTGAFTDSQTLAAGHQAVIGNAIDFMKAKGLGMDDSGSRVGTLSITLTGIAQADASVTVRTTTPVPGSPAVAIGRAGLAYSGLAASKVLNGTAYLCGLRESDSDRSNIALQNAGFGSVTLRVTLLSGDGSTAPATQDVVLAPGGFQQLSVSSLAGGARPQQGFFAKIERTNGAAPFYAYGVINDNPTSDGSFITPSPAPTGGPAGLTLPVVVEASAYSTEVVLDNLSSSTKTVRLTFSSPAISGGSASIDFTLPAQSQRLIPGFVDYLRSNSPAGTLPSGSTYVGPLFVTPRSGDLSGVAVSGRTSNPSPTGTGRLGLFYSATPYGGAATTTLLLAGLQQNDTNRSNLALINTGEVNTSGSAFKIEIFDGDTGGKAAEVTQDVPAKQLVQINSILGVHAPSVRNGWIRVTRTAGVNPFLGYIVVNDGAGPGAGTGDGAFVAGENGP